MCAKYTNQTPLTVSMGKPKISNINPQNRKEKLVYLREQLKAIVEFLYVKESSRFCVCIDFVHSVSLTVHVMFELHANRSRLWKAGTLT